MTRLSFTASTSGSRPGRVVVLGNGIGDSSFDFDIGDTNSELGMADVDPRRERMDDPSFQTDDARDCEQIPVQAKLFRRGYIAGGETIITIKVRPGTEKTLVPLLEDLQAMGQWGCSRDVVIEDFTDPDSRERDERGSGRHEFDGDGSDKIIDIKVTQAEPKKALVKMHKTPPIGAPRDSQRTHLDESVKDEMNPRTEDEDLVRHHVASDEDDSLLEALSALVHKQWSGWSKGIAEEEDLSEERTDRWEDCWVAYNKLPEVEKDKDRVEARQVIKLLKSRGIKVAFVGGRP